MYALSWKLLIIGLLLEYFTTLPKIPLKKIAAKCSIFLHQLYFFLMGRSWTFFLDKDQISSGEDKRKGSEEGMGQKPKMRVIFSKFPLLSKIKTYLTCCWSDWHAQKPICIEFRVILSSFSWSKSTLCILRNKYGFQIGNAKEKIKCCYDSLSQQRSSLSIFPSQLFMQVINCRGQHSVQG